jgi:hypothetical protein
LILPLLCPEKIFFVPNPISKLSKSLEAAGDYSILNSILNGVKMANKPKDRNIK